VNFAPTLQRVAVEVKTQEGTWKEIHGRYTIEFQNMAAKPRSDLRRIFSAPIEDPTMPGRIALRGLGWVRIESIELTNGLAHLEAKPTKFRLGTTAPTNGFPAVGTTTEVRELAFRRRR
jgi:hypothetical protein